MVHQRWCARCARNAQRPEAGADLRGVGTSLWNVVEILNIFSIREVWLLNLALAVTRGRAVCVRACDGSGIANIQFCSRTCECMKMNTDHWRHVFFLSRLSQPSWDRTQMLYSDVLGLTLVGSE